MPALREVILTEARAAVPRECCGLLEGSNETGAIVVTAVHPTRNLAEQPERFEIDPADQFRILRAARGRGNRIVGCYHSHPSGSAAPSARDRDGAAEEHFIWIIAALTGDTGSLGAYAFAAGDFRRVALQSSSASGADTSASQ